jgi:hypothetical protein
MAARPDGKPFIDTINFGSHYCSMYRWDSDENWKILADKKGCRRIFPSATVAHTETLAVLMARRPIVAERAAKDQDPLGILAWQAKKTAEPEAERRRVFGDGSAQTIFIPGGRQVEVVRKRKLVRA